MIRILAALLFILAIVFFTFYADKHDYDSGSDVEVEDQDIESIDNRTFDKE